MSYQDIFILGCGCDVKNLGPAMLVYPKIAHEVRCFGLFSSFVVAVTLKIWSSHAGLSKIPVASSSFSGVCRNDHPGPPPTS